MVIRDHHHISVMNEFNIRDGVPGSAALRQIANESIRGNHIACACSRRLSDKGLCSILVAGWRLDGGS